MRWAAKVALEEIPADETPLICRRNTAELCRWPVSQSVQEDPNVD